MDYHQNARLTMFSREALAKKILEEGLRLIDGQLQDAVYDLEGTKGVVMLPAPPPNAVHIQSPFR